MKTFLHEGKSKMNLDELGQEYAGIILRQETGRNILGETVERYQEGDAARLAEIEDEFYSRNEYRLNDFVENAFEMLADALK